MIGKRNIICWSGEVKEVVRRIEATQNVVVIRLEDIDSIESDAVLQHDILEAVQPRVNFLAECFTAIVTCSSETLEKQGVDNLKKLYRKTIQAIVNDFVDNNCNIPDFTVLDWSNVYK